MTSKIGVSLPKGLARPARGAVRSSASVSAPIASAVQEKSALQDRAPLSQEKLL